MNKNFYGYIRVSSREQNETRQRIALQEFGVPIEHLFIDKHSGKDFDRPAYKTLMSVLQFNDVLVIKSIDRLGRNYAEIIEQWRVITKDKGVNVVVLDMPLLDTRNNKDLMGNVIADIVLNLLSYFAQIEREFNHQRQAEGIAAAKARGVKFGRTPLKKPVGYEEVYEDWAKGKISARGAARKLGLNHNTFLNWVRKKRPSDCL
ncbi:MAG: recombinase family protein [Selenomonadaceae bacterium]|nr:recombinase family protein [Selenomonadaceae bacterium]